MRAPVRDVHRRGRKETTASTEEDHPMSDSKIEAVQRLYAAYGRGDIDGVLAELADDVDWAAEAASTSVPWYGSYRGKNEVPGFFKQIGSSIQVTEFAPLAFTSSDSEVITVVRWAYTVNTTGKTAQMHMFHWWRFAHGKIVAFRGSEDTEQSAAAFS
jgi:ketosteroid isomerase-like protein